MIENEYTQPRKKDIEYFKIKIINWGRNNFKNFPWRSTPNKWHALVAEIMLQRTKAEQVERIFSEFIDSYHDPKDFLRSPARVFDKLGLPERNNQFLLLNEILASGDIPENREALLKLPGIGEYIASAYLSLHRNIRSVLIDSNIVRVYGRFFGFETNPETRRKKWFKELADIVTPKSKHRTYNYAIIDFSRKICKTVPKHEICPVKKRCIYYLDH